MLTKAELQNLPHGIIFQHTSLKGSDGRPLRCRANGKLKTWKTRPEDFQLPVMHGLYLCFYITNSNAHEWSLSNDYL